MAVRFPAVEAVVAAFAQALGNLERDVAALRQRQAQAGRDADAIELRRANMARALERLRAWNVKADAPPPDDTAPGGEEPPPPPAGGAVVAAFRLENAGDALLPAGIATFAQVFAQGEVPRGAGLVDAGGQAAQIDVRTRWPDGSAKHAQVAVRRPPLAPGEGVAVELRRASAPAAGAVDLGAALAASTLAVVLDIPGRAPIVWGAAQMTAPDVWRSGPLVAEARHTLMVPGCSLRVLADVAAFADGALRARVTFANDRAMEAVGGRLAYTATVTLNGQSRQESVDQAQYQSWAVELATSPASGGQGVGGLHVVHDVDKYARLGAVFRYDLGLRMFETLPWYMGGAELCLSNYAEWMAGDPKWGKPFATAGVCTDMPTAGGRQDLGPTTGHNAAWLISQDPRAAAFAMGQAEAALACPWHYWDAAHGTWLNTDHWPRLWLDGRGGTGTPGDAASTGLTQQHEGIATTGWYPERAHQPDLSFVPYLLTGDRWMLDDVCSQAAWTVMELWPAPREDGKALLVNTEMMQSRSAAWGMRQVEHAAWAAPDGSPEKAWAEKVAEANWAWLAARLPALTAAQGECHGYLPTMEGNRDLAPWQQDYFAAVALLAAARGRQGARDFLAWARNFHVGRFRRLKTIRSGAASYLVCRATNGAPYFTTWAEMAAASTDNADWSSTQGEYGRLALCTLAGYALVLGDAECDALYRALVAEAPPWTKREDYRVRPAFAVCLPGVYAAGGVE